MPDLESLRVSTSMAARGAYGRGLIDKRVLHRLQDGTVSEYDVEQARLLVNERQAITDSVSRNKDATAKEKKQALAKNKAAYELKRAVEAQYEKQGSVESFVEKQRDWWNGAKW
jgi:hypothetical protein